MSLDSAVRRARLSLWVCAIAFTAFAIFGSLVPLDYQPTDWSETVERFRNIPNLSLGIGHRADWVANILLFIPLGFFWLGAFTAGRGRAVRLLTAGVLVPCLSALSLTIEFTQIWFPPRTVSQNDIVAESIGGLLGCGVWLLVGKAYLGWTERLLSVTRRQDLVDWLLQLYCLGFAFYSWMPFDLTISLAEIRRKYLDGRILIVPFRHHFEDWLNLLSQTAADILVFVPVGALATTLATTPQRPSRSFGVSLALGMAVAVGLEFGQLFVFSRYVDSTDLVMAALGISAGVWLMHRLRGQGEREPGGNSRVREGWKIKAASLAVMLGYMAFLLAGYWAPFDFSSDGDYLREKWTSFFGVPFASYYWGTEFNALTHLLLRLLLFAPLGVLIVWFTCSVTANRHVRHLLLFLGVLGGFGWGLLVELGQVALPGKVANLTDAALHGVGGLLGVVAAWSYVKLATRHPKP